MESAQRDPRVGVVLNGRYRITELLGEGGMGLVYRGERIQLGRPVAIKFLHLNYAKSPKFVARFEREARAMSKLSHPYCVSVIDFGVHDEPYIVMDFVVGETLRDLMDRERLSPGRAVQITRQILAGLAHAHAQGVIHRDIKPGNVMVGEATGVGDHVRIFDFGLAKLHDAGDGDHSAATVIGTPAYMSPEQTRAEPIDARADLYAVGILLFEMLCGEKPFTGEDAFAVIRKQRDEPPPSVISLAKNVSPELDRVVQRALEKEADRRYQSASEFVAALDAVPEAQMRGSVVSVESQPVAPKPVQKGRALWPLLGLALLALVGSFAYLSTRPDVAHDASDAPDPRRTLDAGAALPSASAVPAAVPLLDGALERSATADAASDAGSALLSEQELIEARSALEGSEDPELASDAGASTVASISDVHKLIDEGKIDQAMQGLLLLRQKSPYNPYLPYLLGDLYFERGAWGEGLAKYREAIALSDNYRKRASIHENVVRALGDDATYARAVVLLTEHGLAPFAEAALHSAASAEEPTLRERAQLLRASIQAKSGVEGTYERRTEE
jgi:eukaryotic-like serine/threonine-protein kinase